MCNGQSIVLTEEIRISRALDWLRRNGYYDCLVLHYMLTFLEMDYSIIKTSYIIISRCYFNVYTEKYEENYEEI